MKTRSWPLYVAASAAALDNLVLQPLVKRLAEDLHVSLADATGVLTAYPFAYGAMQIPWGLVSQRYGRPPVMRAGLLLSAVSSVAGLFAPSLPWLIALRALSGAAMAAVIPSAIAWLGDSLALEDRARAASTMNAFYAIGSTCGVLAAGVLAERGGVHAALGVSAALAASAAASTMALPSKRPEASAQGLLSAIRTRIVHMVVALAFVEGAVLFGLLAFLAPVLLSTGVSPKATGAVLSAYGMAVVLWTATARRWMRPIAPPRSMLQGGILLATGLALMAIQPSLISALVCAIAMAGTLMWMHVPLQVWATDAAPHARGPSVALFASALFLGASFGTRIGQGALAAGMPRLLYAGGAMAALALAASAWVLRSRSQAATAPRMRE